MIAPDFTLRDQDNQEVGLAAFRGTRPVLVVFYPFAFSRICTGELRSLAAVHGAAVQVLAISCDPVYALKAWSNVEGYTFPLLSDFWPHGAVATAYSAFDEARGMALRGTFLVDKQGDVRFAEVNAPGQARGEDVWEKALAAVG